jgi:hypothetical protein
MGDALFASSGVMMEPIVCGELQIRVRVIAADDNHQYAELYQLSSFEHVQRHRNNQGFVHVILKLIRMYTCIPQGRARATLVHAVIVYHWLNPVICAIVGDL